MHFEKLPSNAYIETKNHSYSNLFKLGSENYWKNMKFLSDELNNEYPKDLYLVFNWQDRLPINLFNKKDFANEIGQYRNNYIFNLYDRVLTKNIKTEDLENFFDFNSFSIALINSFVLGEIHSLDLPNSRYYLNHIIKK